MARASPTDLTNLSSRSEVGGYNRQPPTHSVTSWQIEVYDQLAGAVNRLPVGWQGRNDLVDYGSSPSLVFLAVDLDYSALHYCV